MAPSPEHPPADLEAEVVEHVREEYAGVFDEATVRQFAANALDESFAAAQLQDLPPDLPPGGRLLDVGSGYGGFVLAARRAGFDARGIEASEFETSIARKRLLLQEPGVAADEVFALGDAHQADLGSRQFDVVTMWNVVEHLRDRRAMFERLRDLLAPGGRLLVLAPNYASFRREAHYLVPWVPNLPKSLAARYLRLLGRDPAFLLDHVHYCSNRGVQKELRALGFAIADPRRRKLDAPDLVRGRSARLAEVLDVPGVRPIARAVLRATFANPLRTSVSLEVRRP